jgi:hypothetical protein
VAALFVAIFHFFGYATENGRTAALGTFQLDRPSISQQYVIEGVITLAGLGLQVAVFVAIALGVARWIIRQQPDRLRARRRAIPEGRGWGWIVIVAALGIFALARSITDDLERSADGMILKPAKEVGTAWMRMSLDQDRAWLEDYHCYWPLRLRYLFS